MKIKHSGFSFKILDADLERVRVVIPYWKPTFDVSKFDGAMLYNSFEGWIDFVDNDWEKWDMSEYRHEIPCRYWIQLAIEYATEETSLKLKKNVHPIDEKFKSKMQKSRAFKIKRASEVFKNQPYFFQSFTIHPDEMVPCGISSKQSDQDFEAI